MTVPRSSAGGAVSGSGLAWVVIGCSYSLNGDDASSLVQPMLSSYCAQDVAAVLERRLSRPVSVALLTQSPVLPPDLS